MDDAFPPRPGGLRLGIDLDGVVADFNTGWVRRYNAEFGTTLRVDDVVEWNAPVGMTHFASMNQFWTWARTAGEGRSIFRVLDPYDGAIDALRRLDRHHDVVILTTKPVFAIHDTFEWLAEHRVPTREVHITDDKSTVECDVYLDDADHNIESFLTTRPGSLVCRFVQPWGRPHDGAVDVHDWAEFERNLPKG